MDYTEGFPTVSHCADIWGRAHLSQSDLWMATGPDVDLSTLAAWREADAWCIKGRSWNVQHQGRLTIFTSIAPCGRHFKDTSSLKTWAWTFMCCRIYLLHYLHFMWFSFLLCLAVREDDPVSWKKITYVCTWYERHESCVLNYVQVLFGSGWSVFGGVFLMDCFLCRCGSRIAEPSGGRGSALARCNRSGHTSLLLTSCLYWLGPRTMHR